MSKKKNLQISKLDVRCVGSVIFVHQILFNEIQDTPKEKEKKKITCSKKNGELNNCSDQPTCMLIS